MIGLIALSTLSIIASAFPSSSPVTSTANPTVIPSPLQPVTNVQNVSVTWESDDTYLYFSIEARVAKGSWAGVGVSLYGGMLGTRAMVCSVANDTGSIAPSPSHYPSAEINHLTKKKRQQLPQPTIKMQEYSVEGFGEVRHIVAIPDANVTSWQNGQPYFLEDVDPSSGKGLGVGLLSFSFARILDPYSSDNGNAQASTSNPIAQIYNNGTGNFLMIARGPYKTTPLYHGRNRNVSFVDFS